MRTLTGKTLSAIAVVAKKLVAIFGKAITSEVKIHRRTAKPFVFEQCQAVGCSIVEDVINREELRLGFSTACTPPAIGLYRLQPHLFSGLSIVSQALVFVVSFPFFALCEHSRLVFEIVSFIAKPCAPFTFRGRSRATAVRFVEIGCGSRCVTSGALAKQHGSLRGKVATHTDGAEAGRVFRRVARGFAELCEWLKTTTPLAELRINAINRSRVKAIPSRTLTAATLRPIGVRGLDGEFASALKTRLLNRGKIWFAGYNLFSHAAYSLKVSELVRPVRLCLQSFGPLCILTRV